jgi:hypothetical protein
VGIVKESGIVFNAFFKNFVHLKYEIFWNLTKWPFVQAPEENGPMYFLSVKEMGLSYENLMNKCNDVNLTTTHFSSALHSIILAHVALCSK